MEGVTTEPRQRRQGWSGPLCLCSPRYGGTCRPPCSCRLGGPARPRELGLCLVRLVFRFQWRLVYYLSGPVPPSTFDLTSHLESSSVDIYHAHSLISPPFPPPELVRKLVTWDFYHLHNIFSSFSSLSFTNSQEYRFGPGLVLPTYTAHLTHLDPSFLIQDRLLASSRHPGYIYQFFRCDPLVISGHHPGKKAGLRFLFLPCLVSVPIPRTRQPLVPDFRAQDLPRLSTFLQ